ncbi:MAG: DUF2807 domain-containing protein [Pseudomonadales bacterium]
MKNSQISVVTIAVVVLLAILATFAGTRVALSSYVVEDEPQSRPLGGKAVDLEQLSHFDKIEINGNADLQILRGDQWSVTVSIDEEQRDMLRAYVEDNRLVLATHNGSTKRGWNWLSDDATHFSAKVTMPAIEQVDARGKMKISLAGFEAEYLDVNISGAVSFEGNNSQFQQLSLVAKGMGNFDFGDVEVNTATVKSAGATNVSLNMTGGALTGKVSGMSNVSYSGTVSEESLEISGMAEITKNED